MTATEFVLSLGYKADVTKEYFLEYSEAVSNDFVVSRGKGIQLLRASLFS